MACITERKRAGKPSAWQAVIRVTGQPAVVRTFDTPEDAEKFANAIESSLRHKKKLDEAALSKLRRSQPSYAQFYERRLRDVIEDFAFGPLDATTGKRPLVTPPSRDKNEPMPKRRPQPEHLPKIGAHRHCLSTVLENIGNITVGEAKSSWVARYIDKMRLKKSVRGTPYTYMSIGKHIHLMKEACLAAALRADIDEPKLYFNTKAFPKNWKGGRKRRLEHGEHEKIIAVFYKDRSIHGRLWRCLYRLVLETGARLQELVLAEWPEFGHEGVWCIPAEHTKKNTARAVSLSPRARRVISLLRAVAVKQSSLVFHAFGTVASVSKIWAYRMKQCGIKNLRFHDCRHEAITRMVLHPAKLRLETIQEMVGHRSSEMTAKYTHLRPADYVGLFDASAPKR
jgi:integrase